MKSATVHNHPTKLNEKSDDGKKKLQINQYVYMYIYIYIVPFPVLSRPPVHRSSSSQATQLSFSCPSFGLEVSLSMIFFSIIFKHFPLYPVCGTVFPDLQYQSKISYLS